MNICEGQGSAEGDDELGNVWQGDVKDFPSFQGGSTLLMSPQK